MRKIILLVVLAALCQGTFLFAQEGSRFNRESEYYYFNFPIEKIYTYRLGYLVIYRRNSNYTARAILPMEWFQSVDGKGEMVFMGTGMEWPSMTVYYKSGEFSHVRLKVRRNKLHETWSIVPLNINIDEHFQGIEEVKLIH